MLNTCFIARNEYVQRNVMPLQRDCFPQRHEWAVMLIAILYKIERQEWSRQ